MVWKSLARPIPHRYSHNPVQPPKHHLLPVQQGPCQSQGLVTSTQHSLQHIDGQGQAHTTYSCVTVLSATWGSLSP
jgi:hypothetical protein